MNPIEKCFFDQLAEGMFAIDENDVIWRLARYVSLNFSEKGGRMKVSCNRPAFIVTTRGYAKLVFTYYGRKKSIFVHRIVYMHHHGDIPEGLQINHIDGVKLNNTIGNLELVTPRENILHAITVIRTRKNLGSGNNTSKLKKSDIAKIIYYHARRRMDYTQLGLMFGVTRGHIRNIIKRKTWIRALLM